MPDVNRNLLIVDDEPKVFSSLKRQLKRIARNHHEKWDGTGYPDGLKGKDIPVSARIVAIADVFDALAHKRSYKSAWTRGKIIAEMKNMAEKTFDPEILKVFLYLIEKQEKSIITAPWNLK